MVVKVYVKHWCPWCVEALHWLSHRSIPHEVVDVLSDAGAYEHMRKISGQSLTPTLEMPDGEVLPDFDTGQLSRFLTERGMQFP
jgi:glutaredoxin